MTDSLGKLSIPVSVAEPVGDPLRNILGSFLQAAIKYYCDDAWSKLMPGVSACERFETNDPTDNTFHTSKLPCLAVFRGNRGRKVVYDGNDISRRESTLELLWIPPPAVQSPKARRESFYQGIEAAITAGLTRGRVPTWIVDGDTDTSSSYRGSHIGNQLQLMKPIHHADIRFDDQEISIEMKNAEPRKYPALKCTLTIQEQYVLDPTIGTVPAAIDAYAIGGYTVTSNGVNWSILKDPGGYL
jgi:hypothetical protein